MIDIDFSKGDGLAPVIVQDHADGTVLMMAYMNQQAWEHTLETGTATYWSRSRGELWIKGQSSGNTQLVKDIFVDCDSDTILLRIEQVGGAACHLGYRSCFFRRVADGKLVVEDKRVFDPAEVYDK